MSSATLENIGSFVEDVANVPNVMSGTGFALVAHGLTNVQADNTTATLVERLQSPVTAVGIAEVTTGRGFDLGDGFAARFIADRRAARGQEPRSERSRRIGAGTDATLDKLAVLLIVSKLVASKAMPKKAAAMMITANLLSATGTAVDEARHPGVVRSPVSTGKHGMALMNVALLSYAVSPILEQQEEQQAPAEEDSPAQAMPNSQKARWTGHAATVAGVGLMTHAAYKYWQRARD